MSIKILLFGATVDAVGERELELNFDEGAFATDYVDHLKTLHPRLQTHKLLVAVNQEYISPETSIKDGDELAVFTAVSGG